MQRIVNNPGQPSERTTLVYQAAGLAVVALTMIEMFAIPKAYFAIGSIFATSSMFCVAVLLSPPSGFGSHFRIKNQLYSVGFAILLYWLFYGGNYVVRSLAPGGIQSGNEQAIYGLFTSDSLPLLVLVFALDAVGFETFFRGNLQRVLAPRLRIGAVFAVAGIDAAIHLVTLNPLFPITVIVSDSVWGMNYYFTKDIYSNVSTHFIWDVLIFIVFPIH
jgi:membrane protease YdiL (CAAX protease family)